MVKPDYLLHKPAPPPAAKRFLDQQVIPVLIDAAGGLETALEWWAIRVRRSPVASLGIALGAGALLSFLLPRGAPDTFGRTPARRTRLARRRA